MIRREATRDIGCERMSGAVKVVLRGLWIGVAGRVGSGLERTGGGNWVRRGRSVGSCVVAQVVGARVDVCRSCLFDVCWVWLLEAGLS